MSKDKEVAAENAPQARAWYGSLKVVPPSERLKQTILHEAQEERSDAQFGAAFRAHYTSLPVPTLKPSLKNKILDLVRREVNVNPNVVPLAVTKKTPNKLQVLLSVAASFVVLGAVSVVLVYMPNVFRGTAEDSQAFPAIEMRALEQRKIAELEMQKQAERAKFEVRSSAAALEKQKPVMEGASERSRMPLGQSDKPVFTPPLLANQWLEVIRRLAAKGQHAEARELFRKFKLTYPHNPATLKNDWK